MGRITREVTSASSTEARMKLTWCHICERLQQLNFLAVQFHVNIFAPHGEDVFCVGRSLLFQTVIFFNGTNNIFYVCVCPVTLYWISLYQISTVGSLHSSYTEF